MGLFETVDFYTDPSIVEDPYPYLDELLARAPVLREPFHDTVIVVGYDEVAEIYRDVDTFSSCNSVGGPFPGFPGPIDGDDISESIQANRHRLPMHEHLVTFDPPQHTKHRSLLMRLLTPRRIKENEAFMWRLADRQIATFLDTGQCEVISQYSKPFSMLVIADLLGVPESDHDRFRDRLLHMGTPGAIGKRVGALEAAQAQGNWLAWLDEAFEAYVHERRATPRNDVLTHLALATFPDGSTPEARDIVRIATFLFAAGQETTARLIAESVKFLGEDPRLQAELRAERELIPAFIEETLRFVTPSKTDFRLARRRTRLAGVDIPAGTTVTMLLDAANRDPRRFDDPNTFDIRRRNVREHLAFGRGLHTCPGGPLARAEAAVSLNRMLDAMADIRLADAQHGPAGRRHFDYEPSYILRSIENVHIEFTPTGS